MKVSLHPVMVATPAGGSMGTGMSGALDATNGTPKRADPGDPRAG